MLRRLLLTTAVVVAVTAPGCRLFFDGVACNPDDPATCPDGTTCNAAGVCVTGDDPPPPGNGPVCGDALVNGDEACDFAEDGGPACNFDCTTAACGDGKRSADEECDDDNTADGDGCDASCTVEVGSTDPVCGDGTVNGAEACDFAADGGAGCNFDCTAGDCGDGKISALEACDDGNDVDGDGCTDCTVDGPTPAVPFCGDDNVDDGEDCDLGGDNGGPDCNADCTVPRCGDGIVQGTEACDGGARCRSGGENACTLIVCGDTIVDAGEACDSDDRAVCNVDCTEPRCGDGFQQPGEECDGGVGCRPANDANACTFQRCGDGILDVGEQCEGLGCTAQCTLALCQADGTGCFPSTTSGGGASHDVKLGDFNGDGRLDHASVSLNPDLLAVFYGDGLGGFSAPSVTAAPIDMIITAVGDFDNDGLDDVIGYGDNQFVVFFSDGAQMAAPTTPVPVGDDPRDADVGDFNDDGIDDVAFVSRNFNGIHHFRSNGDRSPLTQVQQFVNPAAGSDIVCCASAGRAGDVDGDGDLDLIVQHDGFNGIAPAFGDGHLSVFLNNGGLFQQPVRASANVGTALGPIDVRDVDGDDDLDVVATNTLGTATLFRGRGDGQFDATTIDLGSGGANFARLRFADLNDDGRVDLVGTASVALTLHAALQDASGGFGTSFSRVLAHEPGGLAIGDVDGDDIDDAVVSSQASGLFVAFRSR